MAFLFTCMDTVLRAWQVLAVFEKKSAAEVSEGKATWVRFDRQSSDVVLSPRSLVDEGYKEKAGKKVRKVAMFFSVGQH